jgi:Flp pilus assembly protein TadD
VVLAIACATSVFAQGRFVENWNTNAHEKAERLLSAAMTSLNKGQLAQAATLLIQATQADPTDAAPFAELGLTYVRQGKYGEAISALEKAYHIGHSSEVLLSTGFAYYLQHDYDAAIASWSKALEHDPRMVEVYGDIGFAYMRKGDFVKADESFRNLIKSKPSSQLAYQGLAVLNYLAGHFSAARNAAEHAQSIQSYYPVLLLLAKLDFLQGDPQTGQKRVAEWQRESSGKRALVRSMTAPGYPTQHDFHWDPFLVDNFDNGRLLIARADAGKKKGGGGSSSSKKSAQKGKGSDILSSAKQAQFAAPNDFYITRELGLVEMANGDFAAAADQFSQVLQLCPFCAVEWLHLARVQALQSKASEASYAVREYQRQRPGERIAPSFADLAIGAPGAVPELSPKSDPNLKKEPESGF